MSVTKIKTLMAMLLFVGFFAVTPHIGAYIILLGDCIPNRVATADIVVFGKITAQEKKTTRIALYPDPKVKHRFDVRFFELTVTEAVKGRLTVKTVQVAVFVHPQSPKIKVGDGGCFALSKHYERDFYVLGTGMFFDKTNKQYEKEADFVRRCATLRNDPEKGLASKDKDDRFLTAYLLIYEYGNTPKRRMTQDLVEEPIEPRLSKPILQALVKADWSRKKGEDRSQPMSMPHPSSCIPWIKVDTASKKKWPTVGFFDDNYEATFRAWFQDNADTARLQRMVPKKP